MPTITRFGTVCPGTTLRFDAGFGRTRPDGHTVAKLAAVGFVAVTFNTTAVASFGTNGRLRSRVVPAPQGDEKPPVPMRESRIRNGDCGLEGAPPAPKPVPS